MENNLDFSSEQSLVKIYKVDWDRPLFSHDVGNSQFHPKEKGEGVILQTVTTAVLIRISFFVDSLILMSCYKCNDDRQVS